MENLAKVAGVLQLTNFKNVMDLQQRTGEGLRELALFAGAGGGILGGKLLGWRTVCAVEWDAYAASVLCARQNDGIIAPFPIWNDVQTFDGTQWRGRIDVVSGGFPCQDISSAGKGAGIDGARSGMWFHMARVIGEVRPQYAFVENSPMLTSRGLGRVLGDLAAMGYDARWGVLGAVHAGAPHRRDRIWIVATDAKRIALRKQTGGDVEHIKPEREVAWSNGTTQYVADAMSSGERRDQRQGQDEGDALAHANLPHGEGMRCTERSEPQLAEPNTPSAWWRHDPADQAEPNVGRVAHGVAARVDRLRCIGNGQVPAVAALAWRTLTN
jgi:DNA (cytosine-5)-methyltransferase 1